MKEKNNKLPKWAIILIFVLSFLVTLPIGFIIGTTVYEIIEEETNAEKYLVVEGNVTSKINEEYGAYIITGTIKNTKDTDYYGISVYYNLYDRNNNLIGEATDYIEELKENETWKFSAEYYGVDINDIYRIEFDNIQVEW